MRNTFNVAPEQFKKDLKNDELRFIPDHSAAYFKLPPLVECYWDILENNATKYWDDHKERIIPHQESFKSTYLKRVDTENYSDSVINGIKGRALRAYPSLVRESHFISVSNQILSKMDINATVMSETDLDMERGVDLALILNDVSFSISITKNDAPTDWSAIKEERKQGVTNPHPIRVVVNNNNTFSVGNGKNPLWLFRESKIKHTIKKCKTVVDGGEF